MDRPDATQPEPLKQGDEVRLASGLTRTVVQTALDFVLVCNNAQGGPVEAVRWSQIRSKRL